MLSTTLLRKNFADQSSSTCNFWLGKVSETASGAYGDRFTFTVEVTKPDGTKETLGPFTSDPVGGGWTTYTPAQVGKYTFMAKFQEHKYTPPKSSIKEGLKRLSAAKQWY